MPKTSAGDLLERGEELRTIDVRLRDALAGAGGLVAVEGAAGVGKSALLRELAARARGGDALILTAVGGELEREFPFGLVRQLFEPVVLGATPERREELLSGSAAMAAPVVGGAPTEAGGQMDASFATLHGIYWLVAALAEEQPVVLIMDDCHWADAPSLRFLDFLARRAAELPVLVAMGLRPREPGAEQELLDALLDSPDAILVRPAPLSEQAVDELVSTRLGTRAQAGTAAAAHETTGGNPLLLRELVQSLESADGTVSADAVRAEIPSSVTRSVDRRLSRVSDHAREVATVLAVLGDRQGADLLPAITGLDSESLITASEELADAGLLAGEPPRYAHPLLRQAVGETVSLVDHHRLHRRAAEGLRGRAGQEDQLIVHLLAGPPLKEPWAEEVLREGAQRAIAEGAPEAAVRRLRRALEEHTGPTDHTLLMELGTAEMRSGEPGGGHEALLAAAASEIPEVAVTAMVSLNSRENLVFDSDPAAIADRTRGLLDRLGPDSNPVLRDHLDAMLLNTVQLNSPLIEERDRIFAEPGPDPSDAWLAIRSFFGASTEMHADEAVAMARRAVDARPLTQLHKLEQPSELIAAATLNALDEREAGETLLRDGEETARRYGSKIGRAFTTYMQTEWSLVFGSFASVAADAREALALWQEAGVESMAVNAANNLAYALLMMGEPEEAEPLIAMAPVDTHEWSALLVLPTRARLRLAQGQAPAAVADMRQHAEITERFRWREFARLYPRALLATALVAAGQRDEARTIASDQADFAARTGRVSNEVASLTALGRACEGAEAIDVLHRAAERSASSTSPVIQAEAAIELGAALRRDGQRVEAREQLRRGGEIAARINARVLQDQAAEELSIAGARQRDPFSSGVESLTPSERRVAEHAARGLTNREIAETLFVTQKTIEVHLGNTYGKLGIRSRNQLADALGDPAPAAT